MSANGRITPTDTAVMIAAYFQLAHDHWTRLRNIQLVQDTPDYGITAEVASDLNDIFRKLRRNVTEDDFLQHVADIADDMEEPCRTAENALRTSFVTSVPYQWIEPMTQLAMAVTMMHAAALVQHLLTGAYPHTMSLIMAKAEQLPDRLGIELYAQPRTDGNERVVRMLMSAMTEMVIAARGGSVEAPKEPEQHTMAQMCHSVITKNRNAWK